MNLADLMTKIVSKARIEQLMSLMGYEFVDNETSVSKGQPTTTQGFCRPNITEELGAKMGKSKQGEVVTGGDVEEFEDVEQTTAIWDPTQSGWNFCELS